MTKSLTNIRRSYSKHSLLEHKIKPSPYDQFQLWFKENMKSGDVEPTAMTLATATTSGKPSARVVLLKGFDPVSGFLFFTNYESRKGEEIKSNPQASLLFYWPSLERQVRVEGKVKKVSREVSAQYFQSRPRPSQLGAWTSEQSSPISGRPFLEKVLSEMTEYFKEEPKLPLPPFWGGYTLIPDYFEFWQGREDRLHDRISYRLKKKAWSITRLAP